MSHDLEDILTVVEGRTRLAQELRQADLAVKKHVTDCVAALLNMPAFHNALPGLLSDPAREPLVKARLTEISKVGGQ